MPVWFHLRLVRHGETDANRYRLLESHTPTPLNCTGRRQAAALAAALRHENATFRLVVSSDTARALETCNIALPDHAHSVRLERRARERECGSLHGLGYDEAAQRQAAAQAAGRPTAGLEDPADVAARAAAVFADMVGEMSAGGGEVSADGGEAVLFGHASWIHILLRHLQERHGLVLDAHLQPGAPLHFCWNTGVTRLRVAPQPDGRLSVTCDYLHRDDHLTADLAPTVYLHLDGSKLARDANPADAKVIKSLLH